MATCVSCLSQLTLQNVCPKLNLAHYVFNTEGWAVGFCALRELFWVLPAICILRYDVRHSIDWLCCFFLPTYWLATGWLRQYLNWCVPLVSLLLHNSYAIKCDQCTQHTRNETEKTTIFGTSLVNRCQYLLMKDDLEIVSLFFSIGDSGWKVHPMHKNPINGFLTFRNIYPFYWIHLIDIFFTDLSKADKYWTSIEITNIWWHFRWAGRKKFVWVLFFVMHRTISSAYSA